MSKSDLTTGQVVETPPAKPAYVRPVREVEIYKGEPPQNSDGKTPQEFVAAWAWKQKKSVVELLEKEFAKDGISVVWVQSAGSNKALEFLNAGSIDFGSTAGSAARIAGRLPNSSSNSSMIAPRIREMA